MLGSGLIYLLCGATSCLCAVMLLRGYFKSGVRLLFWSGLCFVGLTIDNLAIYVDVVIFEDVDLEVIRMVRLIPGFIALTLLLYGLIWEHS